MVRTVKVKGENAMDEMIKAEALQIISDNLNSSQLEKIKELAVNPKARDFIDNKFSMIKTFI